MIFIKFQLIFLDIFSPTLCSFLITWYNIIVLLKKDEDLKLNQTTYDYLIVGAGLYGSVAANELKKKGYDTLVIKEWS